MKPDDHVNKRLALYSEPETKDAQLEKSLNVGKFLIVFSPETHDSQAVLRSEPGLTFAPLNNMETTMPPGYASSRERSRGQVPGRPPYFIVNVAVTALAKSMVTVQVVAVPVQAPDHFVKPQPLADMALSFTNAPAA